MTDPVITLLIADLQKVLLAMLLGGLIGLERESREKAAGIRTNIFICLGASLFTILSVRLAGANDSARIAANIVTGIGFLGAGVIFRNEGRVEGMTSAALIWFVAAIGMGVGMGQILLAVSATVIVLLILMLFPPLERYVERMHVTISYVLLFLTDTDVRAHVDSLLEEQHLSLRNAKTERLSDRTRMTLTLSGRMADHEVFQTALLEDPEVQEFLY